MTRLVPVLFTLLVGLLVPAASSANASPAASAGDSAIGANAAAPDSAMRAIAAAGAADAAARASAKTTAMRFRTADTFSLALGAKLTTRNVTRLAGRDLVIVDGEGTGTAQVKALQRRGAVVLAYLSVGSVESWRSWFGKLEDYRLEPLGDWEGERYADVSKPELRDALADDIAPSLLAKGFDGLFLDNVDMVEDHPAQADGMFELVSRLSAQARGDGGVLMIQNGDSIVDRYLPVIDGWNREDPTGTYDFDADRYVPTDAAGRAHARATLKRVRAAGKLTTTTDYFASDTSAAAKRAVRIACAAGAVPSTADIGLRRVAAKPARCSTNR